VSMFVLDHEIEMTEEYQDNMMFIDEMEGSRYSNVPANVEKYDFKDVTLSEIAKMIKDNDFVIPY